MRCTPIHTLPKAFQTVLAFAVLALACGGAVADGGMAGQLAARMTLTGGCAVSGDPGAGAEVGFGTLDFGHQPATFTGVLVAAASGAAGGSGGTQIVCSPDVVAMSVSVSAGNNAGQGTAVGAGARAMRQGSGSYLPYEVYSDAAMTTAYPVNGSAVGVALAQGGAAMALPIFGRVQKTQGGTLSAGTYADVLQVTLSW